MIKQILMLLLFSWLAKRLTDNRSSRIEERREF